MSLPPVAWGAAGDVVLASVETRAIKQEAVAAAVDSQGNVIVTGFSLDAFADYHTVKFKSDGTGVAWTPATYDGAGNHDYATAVVVTSDDDIVVTGYSSNGTDYDFHTIRYRGADGTVMWEHTFNPSGNGDDVATALAVDELNNVYVGGYSPANGGGPDDFMVVKYGPDGPKLDGTPVWSARRDGGFSGHDRVRDLRANATGVVATGESENATPDFDLWTVKFSTDGVYQWDKRYANLNDDEGMQVRLDSSGDVYVAGFVANGTGSDCYLMKFDPSGNPAWAGPVLYDGGAEDHPSDLWVDAAGDAYLTGYSTAGAGKQLFTARYLSGDGTRKWLDAYQSAPSNADELTAIAVDPFGDVFVTGTSFVDTNAQYDILTLKYRKDTGARLWVGRYDTPAGNHQKAVGIGQSASGDLWVGGWTDSGATGYDYLALKYDPGLLNAPTNLQATTVSTTEIQLQWADNSTNEDGFEIERKVGDFGVYTVIGTLPANGTGTVAYSDTSGLSIDTLYTYRVRAQNAGDGFSHYSNEASARTTVVTYAAADWTATPYDNGGQDEATDIAVGPDGNPVVTGFSFDSVRSHDYYTDKFDAATGASLWSGGVRYNDVDDGLDMAASVAVDDANRVVVTGQSFLYGGGAGNTNDIYTLGYPATGGTASWYDQYPDLPSNDDRSVTVAVATDGSGNTAVIGYGKNALANDDVYVIEYASSGTTLWEATPYDGGGHDRPEAVAFAPGGDVIVVGTTHNGTDYDGFVARYSGVDGTGPTWMGTFVGTGSGDDEMVDVAVADDGTIYVVGTASNAGSGKDIFLVAYDSAGTAVWPSPIWIDGAASGDDQGVGVAIDSVDGNILAGGTVLAAVGNRDFRLDRYDAGGAPVWSKRLDRIGTDEVLHDLTSDGSGNVYLVGETTTGGDTDVLAVKYDYLGMVGRAVLRAGPGGGTDLAGAVTVNRYGAAFAAGFETNAAGNSDFLVFEFKDNTLQVPSDVTAQAYYTHTDLAWVDNGLDESGFHLERKSGTCASAQPWTPVSTLAIDAQSYSDTGIGVASDYCYRLRAFRNDGETSRWVERGVSTQTPVPPADLTVTVMSTTETELGWTDSTQGVGGYEIHRCQGAGCTQYTLIDTVVAGSGARTYLDDTLSEATPYGYVIQGYGAGWSTGYTTGVSATTDSPVAPTGLSVTRTSEVELGLVWAEAAPDETAVVVERCEGSGCTGFAELVVLAAGATSYADTAVTPNLTYRYQIRTRKVTPSHTWTSSPSNAAEQEATAVAPTLSVSAPSTTEVTVNWSNAAVSETGFEVERCTGSGGSCLDVDYAAIAGSPFGPDVIAHTDDTVAFGTQYAYRVRATGTASGVWTSPWSAVASVTTQTPSVPAGVAATRLGESSIRVDWNDANGDETGFRVERCQDTGGPSDCTTDGEFAQTGPDQPAGTTGTYDDIGLSLGATFVYRVKAFKTATQPWVTAASATATASTTLDPPVITDGTAAVATACEDLRFSDVPDGSTLLDYWIESGCGTSQTVVHLEVPNLPTGDTALSLFWDNPIALSASNGENTFEFFDDFRGDVIDASKWVEIDPSDMITQNDDLIFSSAVAGWNKALISRASVPRSADREVYFQLTPANTGGNMMLGWEQDQETNPSYQKLSHGAYWTGASVRAYENGSQRATYNSAFAAGIRYEMRIRPKMPNGATYEMRGGGFADWTQLFATAYAGNDPLRVAFCPYNLPARAHLALVRKFLDPAPTVVAATDLAGTYNLAGGGTWSFRRPLTVTNPGGAVTAYALPLAVDTSTWASDRVTLVWTDTTSSETGFVVERCTDTGGPTDCTTDVEFSVVTTTGADTTTTTDRTVVDSTTYQYRVKAVTDQAWTETAYSNLWSVTTGTPAAPTGLTVVATGESRVDLSWIDLSANETHFQIDRCQEGIDCPTFSALSATAGPASGTQTFSDLTVEPNTTYHYQVRAVREGVWATAPTNEVVAATLTLDTPAGLTAAAQSESEILVSWTPQTVDEDGFTVERCDTVPACTTIDVPGRGATQVIDIGLLPSTTYTYRVKAYGQGGSPWETAYTATVNQTTDTPPAPTGVGASFPNTTQIDLVWTDNAGSEDQYNVYRCQGTGCVPTAPVLTTLAAGTEQYSDLDVAYGTIYIYRVEAERLASPPWTAAASDFETTSTSPSAPTALSGAKMSEIQLDLSWTYTQADETGFTVERCLGAGCVDFVEIAPLASGAVSYTDTTATGLVPNKTYRYRVSPVKTGVNYPWSPLPYSLPQTADTIPMAPSAVTASPDDTTSITVGWSDNTATETGFEVERCTGVGCTTGFVNVATGPAGSTAYTDLTAVHSTTYGYRIRAVESSGVDWSTTGYSTIAEATTMTPVAPTLDSVFSLSDTSVGVNWTVSTSDETGFSLERCDTNVGQVCSGFSVLEPALAAGQASYTDLGGAPSRSFCYRVSAFKTADQSWTTAPSAVFCADTPPANPGTTLTASPVDSRTIQLAWSDLASDEDGYELEVQAWDGRFIPVATLPAGSQGHLDRAGVQPSTQYAYRVRAVRNGLGSPYSNTASATTQPYQTPDWQCNP